MGRKEIKQTPGQIKMNIMALMYPDLVKETTVSGNLPIETQITPRTVGLEEKRVDLERIGVDPQKEIILRDEPKEKKKPKFAYVKKDTLNILRRKMEFEGSDYQLMSSLVVFMMDTEIKIDPDDKNTKLVSSIFAKEIPISSVPDQKDIPIGYKMYQAVSTFDNNNKKVERLKFSVDESGGQGHPIWYADGALFFARQEETKKIFMSKKGKTGF